MSLQEKIEKNKSWLLPVILVTAAVALFVSVKNFMSSGVSSQAIDRAYYSNDDGKTYFEDALGKATPFEHEGKQAFRAYVFQCKDGKPTVGFLGRQDSSSITPAIPGKPMQSANTGIEIRKPGTTEWVKFDSPEGSKIIDNVCPDGYPMAVIPGQTNE